MKKKLVLFSFGAVGYSMLEILSRGFTHWSMAVTGGVCMLAIYELWKKLSSKGIIIKSVAGAVTVTLAELFVGLIVNSWLGMNVWSYAHEPYNFMGQICLKYSITWFFLCLIIMAVLDLLHYAHIVAFSKKGEG